MCAAARDVEQPPQPEPAVRLRDCFFSLPESVDLQVQCLQCTSMLPPVTAVCAGVALLVEAFALSPRGSWPLQQILPFPHATALGGLANACTIMLAVVLFTYVFALVFGRRLRRLMVGVLAFCYTTPVLGLLWVACVALRHRAGGAVDWLSFVFVAWNVAVGVPVVVFYERMAVRALSNACIVACALSVCWMFLCFDEYTMWFTLLLMVLWDVFAVLSRYGPIYFIMHMQQHWKYMGEPFELPKGLAFVTDYYTLGTGDLIFYGVLYGRAYMAGFYAGLACLLAILVGFACTAIYTLFSPTIVVPALPITVVIGTVVYFASVLLGPCIEAVVGSKLYL